MQGYKGPGCTGEYAAIDNRMEQMADGSNLTMHWPIGVCTGHRWKAHPSDANWTYAYYKEFYDPVAHTMNYTAHNSPKCDDKPTYTDWSPCDKCQERCRGGWCDYGDRSLQDAIDGTLYSSSMVIGCPAKESAHGYKVEVSPHAETLVEHDFLSDEQLSDADPFSFLFLHIHPTRALHHHCLSNASPSFLLY